MWVCLWVQHELSPPTATGWTAMKFCENSHGPQSISHKVFFSFTWLFGAVSQWHCKSVRNQLPSLSVTHDHFNDIKHSQPQ